MGGTATAASLGAALLTVGGGARGSGWGSLDGAGPVPPHEAMAPAQETIAMLRFRPITLLSSLSLPGVPKCRVHDVDL